MQNYLNQFHNADFCLHCYVQIKVCDTDSSVSLFINHCNHKSWFINLSFMLSTSFHVVKPSGQSQRFEIIAHFWGVDLLFEHWKCNKIRFFRPRPCSAKFWKQGLDLGEVRFLSHFVSTKNHTKTPVAQFLQIMLLGNIMGSHLIWLLAPLFETFAAGTKTLHLLFQIKRAAMSLVFEDGLHNCSMVILRAVYGWLAEHASDNLGADDDDVDNDAARTCPQPQRRPEAIARIEWRWF